MSEYWESKPHVLVISPEDDEHDFDFEIEHRDDCTFEDIPADRYFSCTLECPEGDHTHRVLTCLVQYEVEGAGLDGLECSEFVDQEALKRHREDHPFGMDDYKFLPKGRYEIIAWGEKYGTEYGGWPYEYDGGLTVLRKL